MKTLAAIILYVLAIISLMIFMTHTGSNLVTNLSFLCMLAFAASGSMMWEEKIKS